MEETGPVNVVQLEGLVLLKIIKHCKESLPQLVTGQLLGLDVRDSNTDQSVLEVTHSFPFPSRNEEDPDEDEEGAEYQLDMMRCLREVNVDSNTVGWYQSTYLGFFMSESMIETQFNYQENIKNCVVLVYDPLRTTAGSLSLKAFRLSDEFMDAYRRQKNEGNTALLNDFVAKDILEEVPVRIHNSRLVDAYLYELEDTTEVSTEFDRLDLGATPFLEKNLEFMIECVEDLAVENSKIQYYYRNLQRQQVQQQAYLQKKKADKAKEGASEDTDEELANNPLFRPIPVPSKLDSIMITNQIHNYCEQLNSFGGQSFSKLFLVKGLHNSDDGQI